MAKLQLGIRRVMEARSNGDHSAADKFVSYYQRIGLAPSKEASAAATTPTISEAWMTYADEKKNAKPKPVLIEKNAQSQEATFAEFREIIDDMRVGEITRDTMLKYRNAVARLPSNRLKRYPNKTLAELLGMEIPPEQLPTSRTVHEKLVRIGAFLRWCRITMNYLRVDPLAGVQISSDSQSYAPFSQDDLRKLFNSSEYEEGEHLKSWQYWIPLVALYTGARQTEIAQLTVRDVVQEDGTLALSSGRPASACRWGNVDNRKLREQIAVGRETKNTRKRKRSVTVWDFNLCNGMEGPYASATSVIGGPSGSRYIEQRACSDGYGVHGE